MFELRKDGAAGPLRGIFSSSSAHAIPITTNYVCEIIFFSFSFHKQIHLRLFERVKTHNSPVMLDILKRACAV